MKLTENGLRMKESSKSPNADWAILRSLEIRAMTNARNSVVLKTPIQMPVINKDDAYAIIASLKVKNPPSQKIISFSASQNYSETDIDEKLSSFYESVGKFQFFSFSLGECQSRQKVLIMGSVSGDVVIFYDSDKTTQRIRRYFSGLEASI